MVALAAFVAHAMSYLLTIDPLSAGSARQVQELALFALYRLSAYAVIHLIDDAAILSLIFV
jgi:hypothetical protein